MTENDWLMQFLADIIDLPVDRPVVRETTALGAAMLALMQSDPSITLDDLASRWQRDASFTPAMDAGDRNNLVAGWDQAMKRTLTEGLIRSFCLTGPGCRSARLPAPQPQHST